MEIPYELDPSIKKLVTKDNTIDAKHLRSITMGSKQCIVIHKGMVKRWIGIGWVDEHKAKQEDYKKHPTVVE